MSSPIVRQKLVSQMFLKLHFLVSALTRLNTEILAKIKQMINSIFVSITTIDSAGSAIYTNFHGYETCCPHAAHIKSNFGGGYKHIQIVRDNYK